MPLTSSLAFYRLPDNFGEEDPMIGSSLRGDSKASEWAALVDRRPQQLHRSYGPLLLVPLGLFLLYLPIAAVSQNDRITELINQLSKRNAYARMDAVSELGQSKDVRAVEPLIAALRDKNAIVRARAAEVLGEFNDARTISPLVAALADKDNGAGWNAANALIKMADLGSIDPILEILAHPNWPARQRAVFVLGKSGQMRVVEHLIPALKDADWRVRSTALGALRDLKLVSDLEPFLSALKDPDGRVRGASGEILAGIDDPTATDALKDALKKRDFDIIRGAYRFFLDRPLIESTGVLIELLQRYGTREMAEEFLNAREPGLHKPAEDWARKHKYTILPGMLKRYHTS
jgi:HEAT repeat protein